MTPELRIMLRKIADTIERMDEGREEALGALRHDIFLLLESDALTPEEDPPGFGGRDE